MVTITKKQLKRLEELGAEAEEEFKEVSASLKIIKRNIIKISNIIAQVKKTSSLAE